MATHPDGLCGSIYFCWHPRQKGPGPTALNAFDPTNIKSFGKTLQARRVDASARPTLFHPRGRSQGFIGVHLIYKVERKTDEVHFAESKEKL